MKMTPEATRTALSLGRSLLEGVLRAADVVEVVLASTGRAPATDSSHAPSPATAPYKVGPQAAGQTNGAGFAQDQCRKELVALVGSFVQWEQHNTLYHGLCPDDLTGRVLEDARAFFKISDGLLTESVRLILAEQGLTLVELHQNENDTGAEGAVLGAS